MTKSKRAEVDLGEVVDIDVDTDDMVLTSDDLDDIDDLTLDSADKASVEADAKGLDDIEVEVEVMAESDDLGVTVEGYSEVSDFIVDVDEDVENLTWLIYGRNGTGKTTLLSTTDGMLILAVDEGTLSIKDKAKGKAKKIRVDTWDKLESTYWLLKKGKWVYNKDNPEKLEYIEIQTKRGPFKVKAIGFDTITKLSEVCLRQVVLGDKAKDASIDIMKPTIAHWGQVSQKMKYWLNMYKAIPVKKVWLCQERTNSDSIDNDDYAVFPDVNNALRNYIQSEADIIARAYIKRVDEKNVQFRLLVRPDEKYVTKDRSNALPKIIANPNLDDMYKKVFGE